LPELSLDKPLSSQEGSRIATGGLTQPPTLPLRYPALPEEETELTGGALCLIGDHGRASELLLRCVELTWTLQDMKL
jgi:hypothetical protein